MPLLANLDMEYALPGAPRRRPSDAQRLLLRSRWANILRLLPDLDDSLLTAWGASAEAASIAPSQPWPPLSAVAAANSKATSHALEHALGCALPHSALIHDADQLRAAVAATPHRWVLKHPMGLSGRERVRGDAHALDERALAWAARMWAEGAALIFEPWLDDVQETSIHYEIAQDGSITYLGCVTMLADRTGTLRGHRISPDHAAPPPYEPITRAAIAHIAQLGYHGPVSADTMTGQLADAPITRPITEINARYTFGRMALELRRHAPPHATLTWHHPPASAPHPTPPTPLHPDAPPGLYRLPDHADPDGQSGTYVEIAG